MSGSGPEKPTPRASSAGEGTVTVFDPYGDPFAEDIHDPVVFALNGTSLLHERAQVARQTFEARMSSEKRAGNILAVSAGAKLKEPLSKLTETSLIAKMAAGRLRGLLDDALDQAINVWNGAYATALGLLTEVERLIRFLLTPDVGNAQVPEPPLPPIQDWATVSARVQTDISAWAATVRGKKGQMLIAKPSPGTGKTRALLQTALKEQSQRQRVVVAVRTKDMLVGELEPRVRKNGGLLVRLHVIQGRDEGTCWNYDNVKAVQEHGYAPGSTVCSRCEYHPDIAKKLRTFSTCPYYRSRQNAQSDTASARFGLNPYPLILTTHAGYLTAVESGGGRFGKFWPCDMLMIDEDPTEAFEPEVILREDHLLSLPTPPKPEDRAAHAMAALLHGAMKQADTERRTMEGQGWKANNKPSEIHSRHGSSYAGLALHDLLDRISSGPVGQQRGFQNALQVLRDVSDSHVHPATGALHGATSAAAVNMVVPPRGLSQIGEALFEERAMRMHLRRIAYKKINERDMPIATTAAQVEAELSDSETFDPVYCVRLEFVKNEWRFVFQDFVNMLDQTTNVLLGDAYANVEHYRQLLDKPATLPADPTYTDPVTVLNHIARFPDGSTITRVRTRAGITYLLNEGMQEHLAILTEVFRSHSGQSLLVYGHGVLKERIEKLFADNNDFGVTRWAFENWGGGRGKDEYGDCDAVVTVSDYIQNISGMLHKVNARASKETNRFLARNLRDEALMEGTRIHLDMTKADMAHKMADPNTHWRIRQEHDRQNISELAQALHRVRGLRSPKRMTVVGDGVPFTKDTLAASAVVNPPEGPRGRPKLKSGYVDGFLTEEEAYMAYCQIEEHYGCASAVFSHAFFAIEMEMFLSPNEEGVTSCQGVQVELLRDSLNRDQLKPPDSLSHPPETRVPGVHLNDLQIITLNQRVWSPAAHWKNQYQLANQRLQRTRLASARMAREFPYHGRYVPSWEHSTHPGYVWHSRHSMRTGHMAFSEMLEHQYGPLRGGVLYVPNRKPFVPF